MKHLLKEIRKCTLCENYLKDGVNPVLAAHPKSKIVIIGQAPGIKVHKSSIPWNDKSGERLRTWLNVSTETFYNEEFFAIIPMGFCYPGKGKSGDLPPRKECAPLWHQKLMNIMPELELLILVGSYAQNYYLKDKKTLTDRVKNFGDFLPKYIPLPHPSPRNNIWLKKNKWFELDVIPVLQQQIKIII